MICIFQKTRQTTQPKSRLGGVPLTAPSGRLVTALPRLLDISELALDLLDRRLVAGILADVVAIETLVHIPGLGRQGYLG
jgi:hypothetical protein